MSIVSLGPFLGVSKKEHRRFLPDGVGQTSINQKPNDEGDLRPWRVPLFEASVPSDRRAMHLYRSPAAAANIHYWFTWVANKVSVVDGFDKDDTTGRIYYIPSDGSGPRYTNAALALSAAPYPANSISMVLPYPLLPPTVTLVTNGPAGPVERLTFYAYTWVNSIGWESAPSPPGQAPIARPGAVMDLVPTSSPPADVVTIRWYRTQAAENSASAPFFFLREFPIATAGQQDDGRAVNVLDILPTAADTLRLPIDFLTYGLVYCWGGMVAAIYQNAVAFCDPDLIYAWPIVNQYPVQTPMAMAAFGQRLFVFTRAGLEIFTGYDPAAMGQTHIPCAVLAFTPAGNAASGSVVTGDTFLLWAAADGLWIYEGATPRCVTADMLKAEQWAALRPGSMKASLCYVNGKPMYFCVHDLDDIGSSRGSFIIDPFSKYVFYQLASSYKASFFDRIDRALYVMSDSGTIERWDAGATTMQASFAGGVKRQQEETEPVMLEILGQGDVQMYADDTLVFSASVSTGEHRTNDGTKGRDFLLVVQTTSSIQGVTVE